MPYLKPRELPFSQMQRLLRGYGFSGASLGRLLGTSPTTGKRRMDHPEELTLGELRTIAKSGHVPADELRNAILF